MPRYIALFVEDTFGDWRAHFPDAPGCHARGFSLNDAKFAATFALEHHLRTHRRSRRGPMTLQAVSQMGKWLARNQINLSQAVTSVIDLAGKEDVEENLAGE